MDVLIAVHHFPPDYSSGAVLRAYRTGAWLRNHGHDVHVVCVASIDKGDGLDLTFDDDTYDGLPVHRLAFDLEAAPDPFRWSYDNPWISRHLQGYLGELKPDVLHLISGYLMSGSTMQAASALGVPTVVTLTDFWFLCPRITMLRSDGQLCSLSIDAVTCARCLGEQKRRYRIPGRVAPALMSGFWRARQSRIREAQARMTFLMDTLNSASAIISPSRFLRDVFVEAGIQPGRIVYSRQGRDFPHLGPDALGKVPAPYLRIGYLGQIVLHKGVHVLIEAIHKLPAANIRVVIYGDPAPFPAYVRRLHRLARGDDRIVFAGPYRADELSCVMAETDVVVVPSIWYENSPNIILEAQAHRTVVVASAQGGMAELVRNEVDGLHFAPDDADDLARKLGRFLDEPELLGRLAANAPRVKSLDEEMNELETVYRSVTEQKIRSQG